MPGETGQYPAGFAQVWEFPLLAALLGRRSRRFGLGMTIPDGPLAFTSRQDPLPLSPLERSLLILAGAGVTGWHFGIEHTAAGRPDTLCNYPLRFTGRPHPSAAGIETAELIVSDDSGTFITQFRQRAGDQLSLVGEVLGPEQLIGWVQGSLVRIAEGRVELPMSMPHVSPHNYWNANKPGTTLFIPIVDLTQQLLDFLAIYLGSGFAPYDPVNGRYCGALERFASLGLVDLDRKFSIFEFEQYVLATGAIEIGVMCHNIVLMMQAMGLGGWMYTGINPPSLLGAFGSEGIPGLGFRFVQPAAGAPIPVGRDGVFEALCPPYVPDMRAAVAKFVEMKFGRGGAYDPAEPGPYQDNRAVKSRVDRYTPEFVEFLQEVAQYLYDTFGRFPASIPSVYVRIYAQAQHIDLEFYDRFYGPGSYLETHRRHMELWH
jgi:hypothetical protein